MRDEMSDASYEAAVAAALKRREQREKELRTKYSPERPTLGISAATDPSHFATGRTLFGADAPPPSIARAAGAKITIEITAEAGNVASSGFGKK